MICDEGNQYFYFSKIKRTDKSSRIYTYFTFFFYLPDMFPKHLIKPDIGHWGALNYLNMALLCWELS